MGECGLGRRFGAGTDRLVDPNGAPDSRTFLFFSRSGDPSESRKVKKNTSLSIKKIGSKIGSIN